MISHKNFHIGYSARKKEKRKENILLENSILHRSRKKQISFEELYEKKKQDIFFKRTKVLKCITKVYRYYLSKNLFIYYRNLYFLLKISEFTQKEFTQKTVTTAL